MLWLAYFCRELVAQAYNRDSALSSPLGAASRHACRVASDLKSPGISTRRGFRETSLSIVTVTGGRRGRRAQRASRCELVSAWLVSAWRCWPQLETRCRSSSLLHWQDALAVQTSESQLDDAGLPLHRCCGRCWLSSWPRACPSEGAEQGAEPVAALNTGQPGQARRAVSW